VGPYRELTHLNGEISACLPRIPQGVRFFVLPIVLAGWGGLEGQDSATLRAYPLTRESGEEILVDGFLNEEVWAKAAVLDRLTQQEPLEGQAATERTEVRVLFDREDLYVGIRALDSEPGRIVSRILQRDRIMEVDGFSQRPVFAGDDAVAILFDPFHDRRNAYVFATNPNGAEFDALLADEGREFNVDWRGVWEVAGTRTREGWSAEFRIPLRTLRYPDDSDEPWGFNVHRIIRRKNEKVYWQGWSRDSGGFHRVSLAGELVGLEGLPAAGRNLEVKPYVLGGARQTRQESEALHRGGEAEVGIDLKSEVRPGLVLDLTVNTDFAQVEVDDEQVNLTRFGLFFPEKRDFFLENSGIFQFGVPANPYEPPPFLMFFSRQIGIEEDKEEVVPILVGGRLTGRLGGQTIGVMNVVTDAIEGLVERESFSVARVKRDVGENNYLGAMVTDRRTSETWNTVVGADASLYLTPSLNVQSWIARTFTAGDGGDDLAFAFTGDYSTDRWGLFLRHIGVGPDAEARSGFIQRTDLRRTDTYARRSFRPEIRAVRKVDVMVGGNLFTGYGGGIQDWAAGPLAIMEMESGGAVTLIAQLGENRPDEAFDLADTLQVEPGTYGAGNVMAILSTDPSRSVSFQGNALLSAFYGGTLRALGGTLDVAPSPRIALGLGMNRNRVRIPSGAFTADLLSLRMAYSFSTRLTTNLLIQYNSLDQAFSANFRFNFIHRPGSDLFLVLTEERGEEGDLWRLTDRAMVAKLTYLKRF